MSFFVTVNNISVQVNANMSILQACELANVVVPRFCYHERLSIAGNCRMCLVEVDKMPKLQASCAVPVSPNMSIKTDSLAVKKAREGILEFLLINHPLDCPICDQGGECDLQDQSMVYGSDRSRFKDSKRAVEDKNCGPLIKTVMTRCIHCTRCVRFANEIAGTPQLGTSGRGNLIEIGTYIEKLFTSELSGNVIDLCPVGALTSKPYSFLARPWELKSTESIDLFDCVHSNVRIDTRGYEIMRVLPKLNESINDEWISDKGRFAFDGLTKQRLDKPLLKVAGVFQEITWVKAIEIISNKLTLITEPQKLGVTIGPFADLDTLAYIKHLINKYNGTVISELNEESLNIDFQSSYKFNSTLKNLSKSDACLLLGVNTRTEAALVNYHLRKRYLNGNFKVGFVGSYVNFTFPAHNLGLSFNKVTSILEGKNPFCKYLKNSKNPCIIIGKSLLNSLKKNNINLLLSFLKLNTSVINNQWNGFNLLNVKSSDYCRYDLGITSKALKKNFDVFYNFGNPKNVLKNSNSKFTIYQNHHGCLEAQRADIILPTQTFMEKLSVYGNIEGRYQCTQPVTLPLGKSKNDWKIIYTACVNNGLKNSIAREPGQLLKALVPSVHKFYNKSYDSYFTWNLFSTRSMFSNNFCVASGLFDNFYKTDIVTESSINMTKCTTQLLEKSPFKL